MCFSIFTKEISVTLKSIAGLHLSHLRPITRNLKEVNMVTWKVVLVAIVIAAIAIAVGMWFGYQYVSEKEDISAEGWHVPSDPTTPRQDPLFVFSPGLTRVPIGS